MKSLEIPWSPKREDAPPLKDVLDDPHYGDMICFDGQEWRVARRDGWHYPVEGKDE